MQDEQYKTKDIWVAMCLVALGERLAKVRYDPTVEKVFFFFDTPLPKGRAIEAIFASKDERLVLPVVKLHEAYEHLHRWRVIVSKTRSELKLQEMDMALQELTEHKGFPVPSNLDEAIEMLKSALDETNGGEKA